MSDIPEVDIFVVDYYFPFTKIEDYYCKKTKGILWNSTGAIAYSLKPDWEIMPEYKIIKNINECFMLVKVRFTNTVGLIFRKEKSVDVWVHENDINDEEIMTMETAEIATIKCSEK